MKKFLFIALAMMLTACETAPASYTAQPFAFEINQTAPIALNIAQIQVIESYQSPLRLPNVEHDFPVSPAKAVRKWASYRLKPVGTGGVLEVIITDAAIKETRLKKTDGIKGLFTDDQEARYDATVTVTLKLRPGLANVTDSSAGVAVNRSRSINERATVNERLAIYHQMVSDMMVNFDSEANTQMRRFFGPYLR